MIVAGVDGEQFVVLCGVCGIEIVRANCKRLQTDTKHLTLDTVFHHRLFLLEDFIKRLLQSSAIQGMVNRHVLAAVVHPQVHDTGVVLCLTHSIGNITATLGVLNPELTDALIRIGQREAARLGVRET